MILKTETYSAKCDGCGREFDSGNPHFIAVVCPTIPDLGERLYEALWELEGNYTICPRCVCCFKTLKTIGFRQDPRPTQTITDIRQGPPPQISRELGVDLALDPDQWRHVDGGAESSS